MKRILFVALAFCTLAHSQTQKLDSRTECRYEQKTEQAANGRVQNHVKEVCIEEPGVELKQVRIGEFVRLGHLSPHPVIQNEFVYLNSRCRWFRDLIQYQIIACQVQPNIWQVVDKF